MSKLIFFVINWAILALGSSNSITYPDEIWIEATDLEPETVLYNNNDSTFYVSSFSEGTIYKVIPKNGDINDNPWTVDSIYSSNDLTSSTGFRIFNKTKLYICSNSLLAVGAWTSGNADDISTYNGKQGQVIIVDLTDPSQTRTITLPDLSNCKKKKKKKKKKGEHRQMTRRVAELEQKTSERTKTMYDERQRRIKANQEKNEIHEKLLKVQKMVNARLKILGIDLSTSDNMAEALDAALQAIQKLTVQ
ncbi:hypothetical protein RFI_18178, partial [Reticulomyxa filosa]